MKARGRFPLLMFALVLYGLLPVVAAGQRIDATSQPQSDSCLSASSSIAITVHPPKIGTSRLSFCDGHALGGATGAAAGAAPRAGNRRL